ncbi:uncharacterized protein LOC121882771, partial [Scomber scombrus]
RRRQREGQRSTMVELRWIKMFLFLILGLQFTAVTGQTSLYITVRDGHKVTLSCENVMTDQDKCDSTTWLFSGLKEAIKLIKLGQIGENAKAKSDRLSVTAKCYLVIKNVTVEDVGRYTCRRFDRSGRQQYQDSVVDLSVVSMTEHKDTDKVKLNCSVSTYGKCRQSLDWVYESNDLNGNAKNMKVSWSSCFAGLNFTTSHPAETSNYSELFKCKVRDISGKVYLFNFSPSSPDEDTETTLTPITSKEKMNQNITTNPPSTKLRGWLRFLIVSVGLTALIIIVVSVNIWTRTKGNKIQI